MKLYYTMQVMDEDTDLVVAKIGSYSEEGLIEESGKSKWGGTIKAYIEEYKSAIEEPVYPDDNEDEMSEEQARRQEIESHVHPI